MAEAQGLQQEQKLKFAGFSDQEISSWKTETATKLQDGGFS